MLVVIVIAIGTVTNIT